MQTFKKGIHNALFNIIWQWYFQKKWRLWLFCPNQMAEKVRNLDDKSCSRNAWVIKFKKMLAWGHVFEKIQCKTYILTWDTTEVGEKWQWWLQTVHTSKTVFGNTLLECMGVESEEITFHMFCSLELQLNC